MDTELRIPAPQVAAIRRHAEACYPEECCGVLLGISPGPRVVEVEETIAVENSWPGDRRRRYEIDPRRLLEIHKTARARGLELVGYYHSHPHGAAVPSAFDRERAWPGVSYLIVGVEGGVARAARGWRLADAESELREERLRALETGGGGEVR